jgi:hypothetical protein
LTPEKVKLRLSAYPDTNILTISQGIPGRFSFSGVPHRNYRVQRALSLRDPWANLIEVISHSKGHGST